MPRLPFSSPFLLALAGVAALSARGLDAAAAGPPPSVAVDTVRVDGSNGVLPLVAALAEAYQREHPATVIVIGKGMGSGARLAALREGRIDIALASHGLDTAALVREGFTPHRVATTAVVIGVNAGAPARAISATQLCAVFTGGPPAWRTVTGREEPVAMSVVARAESEVDMEVLRRGVACLTSAPMAPHVAIFADTDAMQRALLASPGAIGITTATVVRQGGARLRALALDGVEPTPEAVASGRYPLVRDSYLVAAAVPSGATARFLAWVRSPAATPVLTANGAVGVR